MHSRSGTQGGRVPVSKNYVYYFKMHNFLHNCSLRLPIEGILLRLRVDCKNIMITIYAIYHMRWEDGIFLLMYVSYKICETANIR